MRRLLYAALYGACVVSAWGIMQADADQFDRQEFSRYGVDIACRDGRSIARVGSLVALVPPAAWVVGYLDLPGWEWRAHVCRDTLSSLGGPHG